MYWISADQLRKIEDSSSNNQESPKPAQRWGQSCVSAHNKLYIIGGYEGQYLGDVWEFDFKTMKFSQIELEGSDLDTLKRSNHTAVYYPNHDAIYVFGGGQAQKARFNDTIKLEFVPSTKKGSNAKVLRVSKVALKANSPIPSARTYHASTLLGKYMIVVGGEANSDLKDLWALDLEEQTWFKPEINFTEHFTPKRFHTLCTLNDHQVITFGGCHSEYVHMNEMHIFELEDFLRNPTDENSRITCDRVNVTQGAPSTRWGHAASTNNGKLYIVGGRNESDVIDCHEFDPEVMKWKQIEVVSPLPNPRRRHSAVFVSNALVLFGGFDGNFYNDLNILDFAAAKKQIIQIQPSSIYQDYYSLVGQQENSDITFVLDNQRQRVFAHKGLVLFRLLQREYEDATSLDILNSNLASPFLRAINSSKPGQEIFLKGVTCRTTLQRLLEYLYCDKFVDMITTAQVRKVAEMCKVLQLLRTYDLLKKKHEYATMKIKHGITKELQQQQPNPADPVQLDQNQAQMVNQKIAYLESNLKLDFSNFDDNIQSPEDKQEKLHNKALTHMNQCKNLDEFYDILFLVEDTLIKANSLVLQARSPYFMSMLARKYGFSESKIDKSSYIKVIGCPKLYFSCIIQYIYSDHFYIQRQDVNFFIQLMIWADFFMLPRLVDICSSYLKQYVTVKSALSIYLLAHNYNADQLENYCINYIANNEKEIMESRNYRNLKRKAQDKFMDVFNNLLEKEKQESFVQICINSIMTKNGVTNYGQMSNSQDTRKGKSSQQTNLSSNHYNASRSARNIKFDEEIDLENLLGITNYLYLEEHAKLETYEIVNQVESMAFNTQTVQTNNGLMTTSKTVMLNKDEEMKSQADNFSQEEDGIYKHLRRRNRTKQSEDKENSQPNMMIQQSRQPLGSICLQNLPTSQGGKFGPKRALSKKNDSSKKQSKHGQSSDDEYSYSDEDKENMNTLNSKREQMSQQMIKSQKRPFGNSQTVKQSSGAIHEQQSINNCNIFQTQ